MKKNIVLFSAVCCSFLFNTAARANWVKTNCPIWNAEYTLLADGTYLFTGTDSTTGVLLSTDNGNHWNTMNNGLYPGGALYVASLALLGNDIFADTQDGIYVTNDSGAQWVQTNYFNKDIPVWSFAVLGNYFYAVTLYGILRSSDNGNNWNWIDSGLTNTVVSALAVSGMNIFAGTTSGMFLSTDSGASWSAMNNILMNDTINTLAVSGTNLFAATYYGVYLSSDNGAHWSAAGLSNEIIARFAITGSNLFASAVPSTSSVGGGVFLSTDNGMNWDTVNTGLTTDLVGPLAFSDGYLFAGTNDGVWRRPLAEMIPEELYPASFQFDTILIGGCRTDTLRFTDTTNTPDTLQGININGKYAKDYSVHDITLKVLQPGENENIIITFCPSVADSENATANLTIGTGDTVEIPMYGAGKQSSSVAEPMPEQSTIMQNYPNPFSATTSINFTVPVSGFAKLDVYNLLGEHIQTLTDAYMNAGQYAVNFDASQLPQGIYFYTLCAGEYSSMRRMTLIK